MKTLSFSLTNWNILLTVSVLFSAFILPVLPVSWQIDSFIFIYSIIYLSAVFSLKKRSKYTLSLFVTTMLVQWFSDILDLPVLHGFASGVNILFFIVIVVLLIKQVATSREVTARVILDSIAGYLLLGVISSFFVAYIMQHDPSAYSVFRDTGSRPFEFGDSSVPFYYSYVTLATLGYGDIVPLKPYTRSLATLIAISGQLYIAVIVALLVGKFSAQQVSRNGDGRDQSSA